mgnify:CR=1 FL=1
MRRAVKVDLFTDAALRILQCAVLELSTRHHQMAAAAQRLQNDLHVQCAHAARRDIDAVVFGDCHKTGIDAVDGQQIVGCHRQHNVHTGLKLVRQGNGTALVYVGRLHNVGAGLVLLF